MFDPQVTEKFVNQFWENDILPTLQEYVTIPCVSPNYDQKWYENPSRQNPYMVQALNLVRGWVESQAIPSAQIHFDLPSQENGEYKTPFLLIEIGEKTPSNKNVLFYGHLDKQPGLNDENQWTVGGPWEPTRQDNKLYGRGSADDGYAIFSAICAVKALIEQEIELPRIVIAMEFCEESGSAGLEGYFAQYAEQIGTPDVVFVLDSSCHNYEQLWQTTSLRGLLSFFLNVEVLTQGVHSGLGSGIVPSSFRIQRELLERLEESKTGEIKPFGLKVRIPPQRRQQAAQLAKLLGDEVWNTFPFIEGVEPVSQDNAELILNQTWRAGLEVVGQESIPDRSGGSVLRPSTGLKLSLRLPPTLRSDRAQTTIEQVLTSAPPYNAQVSIDFDAAAEGWNAPLLQPWLSEAMEGASNEFYGQPLAYTGVGGTLPLMDMLQKQFPLAQFVVTGVLGPGSNSHAPDESLNIPYVKQLTCSVASVLDAAAKQSQPIHIQRAPNQKTNALSVGCAL